MIIYYHCTSGNVLLLSFLLTCHPYIPFHFMKWFFIIKWNQLYKQDTLICSEWTDYYILSMSFPSGFPECYIQCLYAYCLPTSLLVCHLSMSACQSVCLSVCLHACLSVSLPVCLSACLSLLLSVCLSVCHWFGSRYSD